MEIVSPRLSVPEYVRDAADAHAGISVVFSGGGGADSPLTICSEFWVKNHERIVYAIHGGPMNGRRNYQTA